MNIIRMQESDEEQNLYSGYEDENRDIDEVEMDPMPVDDNTSKPERMPVSIDSFAADKTIVDNSDFAILNVLGKGGFGKVYLVRKLTGKDKNTLYAMKMVKKISILKSEKDTTHQKAERSILERVRHPFIVRMHYAYQTQGRLYMILEFAQGGELFGLLEQEHIFNERWACFYLAEITLALGHLHHVGVIYRDLKPENVLLDKGGHVKLADFGLCKQNIFHGDTSTTFCGTVEYMAPEVIKGRGHGKEVDWWSLGTLMYDMMHGAPPFSGQTRDETIRQICGDAHQHSTIAFNNSLTRASRDLIKKLLRRDRCQRLGYGIEDYKAVMKHPFFRDVDEESLLKLQIQPPHTPSISSEVDLNNFDSKFTNMPRNMSPEDPPDSEYADVFRNFTFVNESFKQSLSSQSFHQVQSPISRSYRHPIHPILEDPSYTRSKVDSIDKKIGGMVVDLNTDIDADEPEPIGPNYPNVQVIGDRYPNNTGSNTTHKPTHSPDLKGTSPININKKPSAPTKFQKINM